LDEGWRRADENHVTFEDAQLLGQLIQAGFAQKKPIGVSHASVFFNKCVATAGVSVRRLQNFGILKI